MNIQRNIMSRASGIKLGVVFGIVSILSLLAAASAHAEVIRSFTSDITITKDATLEVVEEIVYDFGDAERHGIFRTIPTTHPEPASVWSKERYIDIEIKSVSRNGNPEPFAREKSGRTDTVRIGSTNESIDGIHSYKIEYVVRGALSHPRETYPEVYWDATGNDWEVPILSARATLYDPDNILRTERSCYRGTDGARASCIISATSTAVVFSSANLAPGEGMTFANAIESSRIATVKLERFNYYIFIKAGFLALVILIMYLTYRYHTRYRDNKPVIAQYEPYPGILPMYTGVLIDGYFDPKDIAAGILYLAEQGYIRIKKTERKAFFFFEVDDYEITIQKKLPSEVPEFAHDLLSLLFVSLDVGNRVAISEVTKDRDKRFRNGYELNFFKSSVAKDLAARGFYQFLKGAEDFPFLFKMTRSSAVMKALDGIIIAGCIVGIFIFEGYLFFAALFFLFAIFGLHLLARRLTRKGYEAVNHLKGYKLYLSVAEADRLKFHNAPEKSPEEFIKHLPYAVAFGVEKEWAQVFKEITITPPDWFDTSGASFSAANLSSSLGAFSSSLAAPSGSSAASGGGSSGGGAGGGGGGSW